MKGSVVNCLKEAISNGSKNDKWEKIKESAGLPNLILDSTDVDDSAVIKAFEVASDILQISPEKLLETFADHWIFNYAKKIGYSFFLNKHKTAKDALLEVNKLHQMATSNMKGAKPPVFEYTWENNKTLIVEYNSHRGLLDMCLALTKSLGKYYKENLMVSKVGNNKMKVVFL